MLSTKPIAQFKRDTKACFICGTNILLDHHMLDEHGVPVHTSCHEKRLLMKAAAEQTSLWRRNLPSTRTA